MMVPKGSRRMWGIGLSVTWPLWKAVGSPPHLATSACEASWQVRERRKTMYQTAPVAMSSGFILSIRRWGPAESEAPPFLDKLPDRQVAELMALTKGLDLFDHLLDVAP